jgi:hypothetical protein
MNDFIIGSITTIVSFVLGLFGKVVYDLWRDEYLEKRLLRNQGVMRHYHDFEKTLFQIEEQLLGTYNNNGLIYSAVDKEDGEVDYGPSDLFSWPFFEGGDKPEIKNHFPREADDCDEVIKIIATHNNKVVELDQKLYTEINKVFENETQVSTLSTETAGYMREDFCQLAKEKLGMSKNNSLYDSTISSHTLNSFQDQDGKFVLSVSGHMVAKLSDKSTLSSYTSTIANILDSKLLLEQLMLIVSAAEDISSKAQDLGSRFTTIKRQYTEFGKKLKRNRHCPTCHLIFS